MSLLDLILAVWLAAGSAAFYYSWRKYRQATADRANRHAESGDGQIVFLVEWGVRSARFGLALGVCFFLAPLLSLIDKAIEGPPVLGLVTIIVLTILPVAFALLQRDDARSHDRLWRYLSAPPNGTPERRQLRQ